MKPDLLTKKTYKYVAVISLYFLVNAVIASLIAGFLDSIFLIGPLGKLLCLGISYIIAMLILVKYINFFKQILK